jgi:hypothetical protein
MMDNNITGVGEIVVKTVPKHLIKKLNEIAEYHGLTRQAFLKTEYFKIVERFEANKKR